jgi:Tfp pilus assembly protein PilV
MFVVAVILSEVLFGWATQEELQPNIDGLSLDEVVVAFLLAGVAVLAARGFAWRRSHRPRAA